MALTKKAERAVKASIKHWKRDILAPVEAGTFDGVSHGGGDSCPCCKAYYRDGCGKCPLSSAGASCCGGRWMHFHCLRTPEAARSVIAYMESVLEESA